MIELIGLETILKKVLARVRENVTSCEEITVILRQIQQRPAGLPAYF